MHLNFLRDELIQEEADIYLCGPPPMIEASERWLVEKGIDKKFVHSEKFVPSKVRNVQGNSNSTGVSN